jgi:hypothetical protein
VVRETALGRSAAEPEPVAFRDQGEDERADRDGHCVANLEFLDQGCAQDRSPGASIAEATPVAEAATLPDAEVRLLHADAPWLLHPQMSPNGPHFASEVSTSGPTETVRLSPTFNC